jgi:YhcH/YjgK/YiaL family protein
MIVDSLESFELYVGLNPLFPRVAQFLRENDLSTLSVGKHVIAGDDLFVNIQEAPVKTREQARFESHRKMIDIQIPISAQEEHGWCPLSQLPAACYDENNDMTLHDPRAPATPEVLASTYYSLKPGQFAIYFPTDGHAPAVTSQPLRKAIFKVKA